MKGITCERRVYKDMLLTHSHIYAQLILPLHGVLDIQTNYRAHELDEKHLFFLPAECTHTFQSKKSNEFLVLDIPSYMFSDQSINTFQEGIECLLDEKWEAIRFLILSELNSNGNKNQALTRLFHYFYPMISKEKTSSSIKYIHEHFNEDIDLNNLASIEHYNVQYYSEWFKKNNGISPVEYIQKLRIQRAKELLLDTDLSIIRVANEVGYSHNSSLTRIFKAHEKISPASYRLKNRKTAKK